jgi:hypothetical protein
VPEATLDERFAELRRFVEEEIARERRDLIAGISRALTRMRAASNESEWNAAVLESGRAFSNDPAALELLASLAALTAPSSAPRAADVSAQRFAKVKIAEIQLYQSAAVKTGRAAHDLYGSLKPHIDAAREAFREKFLTPPNGAADYLHTELVRVLANDDATLLGPAYPGPLV